MLNDHPFGKRIKYCTPDDFVLFYRSIVTKNRANFVNKGQLFGSMYYPQLASILKIIPAERIKIWFTEELFVDTLGVLRSTENFIGVRHYAFDPEPPEHVNAGKTYPRLNESTRAYFDEFFKPHNLKLKNLLAAHFPNMSFPSKWSLPSGNTQDAAELEGEDDWL